MSYGQHTTYIVDDYEYTSSIVHILQVYHPCSYVLTIIARDRADEPRSSNATIYVTVRDENDNPPIILNITNGITVVSIEEVKLLDIIVQKLVSCRACNLIN